MISDIVFGIVILALIGAFMVYIQESTKEKAKLINALVAKTPEQVRDLTLADKVRTITPPVETPPDLVPLESLSDEDFETHIKEQLENI